MFFAVCFLGGIHDDYDDDSDGDANGDGVIDNDESLVFRTRNLCNIRVIRHKLTVNRYLLLSHGSIDFSLSHKSRKMKNYFFW